jgi:HEAT repeat protein
VKSNRLLLGRMACSAVALVFLVAFGWAGTLQAADGGGDEIVQLVVDLLGDKDKDVRALGFEQVRTGAKGRAATQRFAAQLPKLPPDAQVGLLTALADRGDAEARPAVVKLLSTSREESVRVAAIGTVGFLGIPADVRLLTPLLARGAKAEQAAARASLVRLRGEAAPAVIVAEMQQAAPPLRVALIEILATRGAKGTVPDILPEAVHAEPAVRAAAMTALGQLAGSEHLTGMVQGVLKAEKGAERAAAEKAVMLVCGRIADVRKRAEPLLAVMDKLEAADRTAMLPTLGRVGGPAALVVVERAIAAPDPLLHEVGVCALCNWPDASIAPRLFELATADQRPELRTMALAALIRVAPLPDKRPDDQRLALVQKVWSLCTRDADRNLLLSRARAIRTLAALRFVAPYMDQPAYAQAACETVVELAHHRELREANKAEFHRALDKVIQTSKDATVVERANRYKKNQTWARPVAPQRP